MSHNPVILHLIGNSLDIIKAMIPSLQLVHLPATQAQPIQSLECRIKKRTISTKSRRFAIQIIQGYSDPFEQTGTRNDSQVGFLCAGKSL